MRAMVNIINNIMLINAFNEIELLLDFFIAVLFVVFILFTIVGVLKKYYLNNWRIKMLITVFVGLPGCGKKAFARGYAEGFELLEGKSVYSLDLSGTCSKMDNCVYDELKLNLGNFKDKDVVLVDGLFFTNESIINLINSISRLLKDKDLKFDIHYWNLNREKCIENVKGNEFELKLAQNASLDIIDIAYITNKTNLKGLGVIPHK